MGSDDGNDVDTSPTSSASGGSASIIISKACYTSEAPETSGGTEPTYLIYDQLFSHIERKRVK